MLVKSVLVDLIYDAIKGSMKFSVPEAAVKENIRLIMDAIEQFNSMKQHQHRIFDEDTKDIIVLGEFAPFVYPKSVKYDISNPDCVELRQGFKQLIDNGSVQYESYFKACKQFRGWFKESVNENTKPLAELQAPVDESNIVAKAAYGNRVLPCNDVFVPVPLTAALWDIRFDKGQIFESADKLTRHFIATKFKA